MLLYYILCVCFSIDLRYAGCVGGTVQHAFSAVAWRLERGRRQQRHSCSVWPVGVGNVAVPTADVRHNSAWPRWRAVRRYAERRSRRRQRRWVADGPRVWRSGKHVHRIYRVNFYIPRRSPVPVFFSCEFVPRRRKSCLK